MVSWKDHYMQQEQHKDRLRHAQERRLYGQHQGQADLVGRILAWLGGRLQEWGRRLEASHGAGRSLSRDGFAR